MDMNFRMVVRACCDGKAGGSWGPAGAVVKVRELEARAPDCAWAQGAGMRSLRLPSTRLDKARWIWNARICSFTQQFGRRCIAVLCYCAILSIVPFSLLCFVEVVLLWIMTRCDTKMSGCCQLLNGEC
ncbi:hypothetical protein K491DRAFT_227153 [Lophiostoma macrostomum CBS 122681]|uniref:Uncharacterized protein n=1 Tax=Lophiostoma macrostomum CBS 122681 TaxID=1314788 RepID=A0A6A6TGP1_9PLEO|nr:hypothetical protein K491DRAFT_227153 [Lophiostoma macrostomum CBS 122681]